MKKSFYLPLVALIFAASFLPAQTLLLPLLKDSTHYHYYDSSTGDEQFKYYSYHYYNSDNLEDTAYYHNYFGSVPNFYRYDYVYNSEKLLTKSTSVGSSVSPTGPWENSLKDEYTYDAQGRNNHYIGQLGNSSGGWDNYYQETFWFDDVTPADSSAYELWDAAASDWGNYRRYFNYYYPTGDLKQHHEDEWLQNVGMWSVLLNDEYTYYPDGKIRVLNSISFDVNQVSLEERDSFIYRLDGKIDSTFSNNETSLSGEVNYFITKYAYDSEGHLIQKTAVSRQNGNPAWTLSSRQTFIPGDGYYSDDPVLESQQLYNVATHNFDVIWEIKRQYTNLGGNRVLYREERTQNNNFGVLAVQSVDSVWYNLTTVPTSTPIAISKVDCRFANPFQPGNCVVCTAADKYTMMTIRIMNSSGQLVAQGRVMPGEAWNPGANMPAGVYVLGAWQNGKFLGERKMVVAK